MNVQDNVRKSNALQNEYQLKIQEAEQDRAANSGNYSKEGCALLTDAARIQVQLQLLTNGIVAEAHKKKALELTMVVHKRMQELGLIEKKVDSLSTSQPQSRFQAESSPTFGTNSPSNAGIQPNTGSTSVPNGELPEGFTIEKFILPPQDKTLNDIKSQPALVKELGNAIYGSNIQDLFPDATKNWNDPLRSNFLFYGPPGTGKSFLCKAISGELAKAYPEGNSAFFLVDAHDIASKYVGTTGHILKAIFEAAERYDLAVICVDEIEALCPSRDGDTHSGSNYTQNFLELINGVRGQTKALIIACTNNPWKVDTALLSRLNRRVFIDYPTMEDIVAFFSSSKEYRDYFGTTQDESDRLIAVTAQLSAAKHYSFRNLNALCSKMRSKVEEKTLDAYPEGNPNLKHMLPLSEDEIRTVIDELVTDYTPVQYQRYAKYTDIDHM